MTLIEVMAGLVVLGVLVGSTLAARGRYLAQSARAQRQLDAAAAAETFLQSRWEQIDQLPRSGSGAIDGSQTMTWKTTQRAAGMSGTVLDGSEIVCLQILDAHAAPEATPLMKVELLLPRQKQTTNSAPVGRRGR